MAIRITARWNGETDVTKVQYSDEFEAVYAVAKLDFLKDVIWELQNRYDAELIKNRKRYETSRLSAQGD